MGGNDQSVQAEHCQERCVDLPLLVGGDSTDVIAETVDVDCAELLDEHTGASTGDIELGSKRRRPGACRSRRDEHHRSRQHRVGLDNDPQSSATLLMSNTLG